MATIEVPGENGAVIRLRVPDVPEGSTPVSDEVVDEMLISRGVDSEDLKDPAIAQLYRTLGRSYIMSLSDKEELPGLKKVFRMSLEVDGDPELEADLLNHFQEKATDPKSGVISVTGTSHKMN